MSEAARRYQAAVVLIGMADEKSDRAAYGTGFVISRRHRLVATNAHVADLFAQFPERTVVIRHDSNKAVGIERVWYHPGAERYLAGSLRVRSPNWKDGQVVALSPDVAVLQLEAGADLPVAFPLASPREIRNLFARQIGMLGFPGHDHPLPTDGRRAQATFHTGAISRLTDFRRGVDRPDREWQLVQYTMSTFGGFSGSPVFLSNGNVVAINNSSRTDADRGNRVTIAQGIRIDCLWELLAHHGLDHVVDVPVERERLRLERFEAERARDRDAREAVRLIRRAEQDFADKRLDAALDRCTQAIALAKDYESAYLLRAEVRIRYQRSALKQESRSVRLKWVNAAMEDLRQYERIGSVRRSPHDQFVLAKILLNLSELSGRRQPRSLALDVVSKLTENDRLSPEQMAQAYYLRAFLHPDRDVNGRLADASRALSFNPYKPEIYQLLAWCWYHKGDREQYQREIRRQTLVEDAERLLQQAWTLLQANEREPNAAGRAIAAVEQACELTEYSMWKYVLALGTVHYAVGNRYEAAKWARRAAETAPTYAQAKVSALLQLATGEPSDLAAQFLARRSPETGVAGSAHRGPSEPQMSHSNCGERNSSRLEWAVRR